MSDEIVIDAQGVWKIFGARAKNALRAIREEGLGKAEVRDRFECVVGVADANFQIRKGELFCVMGLSGSGKSTLVRHVNRLLEPTDGHIFIDGDDVMALDERGLRDLRNRRVSMVFQNFGLMPHRTVRDNVAMPLEIRGTGKARRWAEADRVLDLVDLQGWEDKYAHELSGGMQQRVGLARAIASDPEILLMDEPFSALDPLIRKQLQDQFMQLSRRLGKTTMFITHDLDEAIRIGHRIAIMKDGRIVQIGTPEEIILNPVDDYVADFVAGISKLDMIFARSVMQPTAEYEAMHGPVPGDALAAHPDMDLNALMDLSVQGHGVLRVTADHATVGIIDRARLIRAIQSSQA
ncbi:betaine/proline/choline family ABC transporter ATP-binding protein [Paracoccus sp. 1_MG-2023]|uniref:quaternary amine ABC transporter ATP-binding protein n=1 Tax=unclassified Paracoccus (in: a-proteobacteria) TaxID=2688777 RepID=UPI001C0838FB|nr:MULTISPECIES: betaine/proline/choline family ABC transporter ATP-binding protein [unclassified Paracoccus (in: a-proteobacteria)]MBU2957693.1 betaine/proline/choline family ABC transporter ATP-binding protein [Paracoccus sp. C2R09]MDO6667459.1 betaine/proline/choline family ABC transporter ATP-binding protein [Paracoccus sp. 1_MG-2023]